MKIKELMITNPHIKKSIDFDKKLLTVPLQESYEGMISLIELSKKEKVDIVFDQQITQIGGGPKTFFLRKSVALALMQAAQRLNDLGFVLKIHDAYRSLKNQQHKFIWGVHQMRQKYPKTSSETISKITNIYIAGIPILAAHTAGAAVDVSLLDKNYHTVGMGTQYGATVEESTTNNQNLSEVVKVLRKRFCKVMNASGFSNYPFEWWHYSIGDVCDSFLTKKKKAIYGPLEFNPVNKIVKYLPKLKNYQYFELT